MFGLCWLKCRLLDKFAWWDAFRFHLLVLICCKFIYHWLIALHCNRYSSGNKVDGSSHSGGMRLIITDFVIVLHVLVRIFVWFVKVYVYMTLFGLIKWEKKIIRHRVDFVVGLTSSTWGSLNKYQSFIWSFLYYLTCMMMTYINFY